MDGDVSNTMRRMRWAVLSREYLMRRLLRPQDDPSSGVRIASLGVPKDARIVTIEFRFGTGFAAVLLESDEFEPVPDGSFIPELAIMVSRMEDAAAEVLAREAEAF